MEWWTMLVSRIKGVGARARNNILGHGPYPRTLNYQRRGQ